MKHNGHYEEFHRADAQARLGLVGINLATAGHLAQALARQAAELAAQAEAARSVGEAVGLAPMAAARLTSVARWAEQEAAAIRAIVERLRDLDARGVVRGGSMDLAFARPGRSVAWGQRILAAIRAGRRDEAVRLLADHGDDPVVAAVVIGGLGAGGIVALLRPAVQQWARTGADADVQRDLVLRIGALLARAERDGTTPLEVRDLVAAADRRDVPLAALALLFVGGARFPSSFLRDAVVSVVAPINATVRTQPGMGVGPWMIPAAGAPLDARVVLLAAVAQDHEAAVEAVGAVDLDDLLAGSLGYADGGVALAGVLLAATTPLRASGEPVTDPLLTPSLVRPGREGDNARRVIEWIGVHRDVPLAVHAELGRLARPWVGAFRGDGLDRVVARPFVLDEEHARAYLTYAQARDRAAEDLQDDFWLWAAGEIRHLAVTGRTGPGFDAVGSGLGILTITRLDADASAAIDVDRRITRQNALWRRASNLATDHLPPGAREVTDPLATWTLTQVLSEPDHELVHWRDLRDLAVAHEYLALDHLVVSALWAQRGTVGLPSPPRALLVDPRRPRLGLRRPVDLDSAGVAAWTRWRSTLAGRGVPARQVAGDQFLAETRS